MKQEFGALAVAVVAIAIGFGVGSIIVKKVRKSFIESVTEPDTKKGETRKETQGKPAEREAEKVYSNYGGSTPQLKWI